MTRDELLNRIWIDPARCGRKSAPRAQGLGVPGFDMLAGGSTPAEILENYPGLGEDILACIAYGSEMTRERFVSVPLELAAL